MLLERWISLSVWSFAGWILLTWSPFTLEQELFGAGFAMLVAGLLVSFGDVARPWRLLDPRRLLVLGRLGATVLVRIVAANISLARRILSPSRPLASGMVIVPTELRSEGALTAAGLLTSVIVDNQIVDFDLARDQLQYHAVEVRTGAPQARREAINGPLERLVRRLLGGDR